MGVEKGFNPQSSGFEPDEQANYFLQAARWSAARGVRGVPDSFYDSKSGEVMVQHGNGFKPQSNQEHDEKPFSSDP